MFFPFTFGDDTVYVWLTYSCLLASLPSLSESSVFQHIPPSRSWAYWAALLNGRCAHCPARSLRGWIRIHSCTASSHDWMKSGRSCASGSESNHLHLCPYRRKPASIEQNVIEFRGRHPHTLLKSTQKRHATRKTQVKLTFSSGVPRKSSLGSLYSPEIL